MKKRLFSIFLAVLMVVLLLPVQTIAAETIKGAYVGQNFETVIDSVVGAKVYSKSGNFPEGLTLSGTWKYKENYGDTVFEMTLSGTPKKAGTYNFTVTYMREDKTVVAKVNYTLTVGEEAPFDFVESLDIDKWPDKTVYYLGDTIDLTGLKVTAVVYKYDAETRKYVPKRIDVTDLIWVSPEIFTYDESQNVTVYLKAPKDQYGTLHTFSDTFRVSFKYAEDNEVTRIEIYKKPTKLIYTEGEKLDTTGLTVRLHKGDGNAEDITSGFTTDVTTLDTVGTKTVTVKYTQDGKEFTATFDVTVEEKVIESSSSSSSEPEPSSSSSSEEKPSSSSEPEETSSSSSSEPEETSSSSEPDVPVSEPSSEPSSESSEIQEIEVIGGSVEEPSDDEGGIPFWVWIIVVLLVVLVGAAVALFLIGRKRLDDEY